MPDSPQLDPLFLAFQAALAGRYSIDREIGRGGMGIVYLAREVHLDRPVAIKLLPPERARDGTLKDRFLREARLAAKLSHPNIIPIHAVDDAGGFVFYVMAFVDGETLADRVRSRGPLPSSEGTRVFREAAWALAHAHETGLVHRDVKPDNILLERGTGRVLVADFGIAAAIGSASAEGVTGTPEFMSPEQALDKELDARSDLYSLGATAFYAFSGRLVFEGDSATAILAKHVTETAPQLGTLGLAVPRKVALLVDRCLAKEPEHRPADANALAEQLGVALEQKRELPVALRAFVKRSGRIDSTGTLFLPPVLFAFGVGTTALTNSSLAGFAVFFGGMLVAPLSYMINAAKKLSMHGFAHLDLEPAFREEIERSREEHAVEHAKGASRFEKALGAIAKTTGPFWVVLFLMLITQELWVTRAIAQSMNTWFWPAFTTFSTLFYVSGLTYLAMLQRRRDVDTEFWNRVWMGRVGRAAFAIGRKLLGNRIVGSAMTHRATELSLGLAAEQLYEALPKPTRAELGDLIPVLKRLQDDAQRLRKHHDALQEAINDAGDAGLGSEYADIRVTRDELQAKLSDAVGALETIRLNLLRLHAGSGTVQSLTTHIGIAADLSEEVERLLAAKSEMERGLAFPREIASTPA
jgi:serine/threonine-protein kinase